VAERAKADAGGDAAEQRGQGKTLHPIHDCSFE
jgi:hypothetical protein